MTLDQLIQAVQVEDLQTLRSEQIIEDESRQLDQQEQQDDKHGHKATNNSSSQQWYSHF